MNKFNTDFGYKDSFWMKVSDKIAVGFGEFEGVIAPPEEIEAWVFNEFSKEAQQLETRVIDFRIKPRIKCLNRLKANIVKQIKILEEQDPHLLNKYESTLKYYKENKKIPRGSYK
jgi:hypothetical protein